MIDKLDSKVAVVTGAANGIGQALSRAFVAEGMHVVLADVDRAGLETVKRELEERGGSVVSVQTDVSDRADVLALAEKAFESFGAAHVLCNNAGIIGPRGTPLADIEPVAWQRVFAVNVLGVLHGIQAFIPPMLRLEVDCHIVNTASVMGWIAMAPIAAQYSASKHAVVSLTESLQYEAATKFPWLGVSVLCPGPVDTEFRQRSRVQFGAAESRTGPPERDDSAWANDPARRGVTAEEVAAAVVLAVRTGEFYVFPNPGSRLRLERQFNGVLNAVET